MTKDTHNMNLKFFSMLMLKWTREQIIIQGLKRYHSFIFVILDVTAWLGH